MLGTSISIDRVSAQAQGEWRAYAADKHGSRYSPLDQINKSTVGKLRVAWRQSVMPAYGSTQMSDGDLDDLLSYLNTLRGTDSVRR